MESGKIVFTYGGQVFDITPSVIRKALKLPEVSSYTDSFSESDMYSFISELGYNGDMTRMGQLFQIKMCKEWNFYFDCIGR